MMSSQPAFPGSAGPSKRRGDGEDEEDKPKKSAQELNKMFKAQEKAAKAKKMLRQFQKEQRKLAVDPTGPMKGFIRPDHLPWAWPKDNSVPVAGARYVRWSGEGPSDALKAAHRNWEQAVNDGATKDPEFRFGVRHKFKQNGKQQTFDEHKTVTSDTDDCAWYENMCVEELEAVMRAVDWRCVRGEGHPPTDKNTRCKCEFFTWNWKTESEQDSDDEAEGAAGGVEVQ